MNDTISTVCLGLVTGVFVGSLGLSGAELMIPGLLVLGVATNFKTAAGTVLLTITPPIYLSALYVYYKNKQIKFKTSIILMITCFITAYFGAKLAADVSEQKLQYMSGAYLMLIGLFMFYNAYFKKFGFTIKDKK